MIDLKELRENPDRFREGARLKNIDVDIDRLMELDEQRRRLMTERETRRSEQNRISKELGPKIGKLKGMLKTVPGDDRATHEAELAELEQVPVRLKNEIQEIEVQIADLEPEWRELWLQVPAPPDDDVPRGASSDDNIEISRWNPDWFDPAESFEDNKGFAPRTHIELVDQLGLVDFERGVKMSGTRNYVLTGDGALLHQAVLRFGLDLIVHEHGFSPMTIPVLVREEAMIGTGFFPAAREESYRIDESNRGAGHDLYPVGTGEVALMGFHSDEIVEADTLPLQYATVSTCFRREAGAAGRDTAGLFRVHQFEKVEQVVICRNDEQESRRWHKRMIGIVEELLRRLQLPHRLLQCCTGDLGAKNADMIDLECWMPGRGEEDDNGRPTGAYGESHSASRLYDYQCRRLNMRYRDVDKKTAFCHSLNNTVVASPRILIPILEMYQNKDGSVTVPEVLRPYMGGKTLIAPA